MLPPPTSVQTEAEAWYQSGSAAQAEGRLEEAVACFTRALALNSGHFPALFARGVALHGLRRFDEAAGSYDLAARIAARSPELYVNRGIMWLDAGKFDAALADFDRALALNRDFPEAQINRGNALKALGRLDEALAAYDRLLVTHPRFAGAHNSRGNVLQDLGRLDEALAAYHRALQLEPGFADAWNNRGDVLQRLRRFEEAIEAYDRLLALAPGFAPGHKGRGMALQALMRPADALAAFDRAVALRPGYGEAWSHRGGALLDLKRYAAAVDSYDRALALDAGQSGGLALIPGMALHARMQICEWSGFDERLAHVVAAVETGQATISPFALQALIDAPELHLKAARAMIAAHYPPPAHPPAFARVTRERLRIGYVSSDFRDHPVSHAMAGVFEHHDRDRFEIHALSLRDGPAGDPWRTRIMAGVDHFVEASGRPDRDLATLARSLGLDVAIDLDGLGGENAPGLFAGRAAPVQAVYIGHLGTTGAPWFDYLIADRVLIPEAELPFYSEKIAYLPSYQAYDDKTEVTEAGPSREDLGLPEGGIVFCAFTQPYRIMPDVFDTWMRVLVRVPLSVLWLYAAHEGVAPNLRREAERRGVDPRRLIFAPHVPLEAHLARLKQADLFLDTAPGNAGATAGHALRTGIPVVTRAGRAMAGRMAASLLRSVGLDELVTQTNDAYEDLAVALATDPSAMAAVRRKLQRNLAKCALFDTVATARSLEAAYTAMHARWREGLAPDHIQV
jgi:predicted O-linked N-acetylglucosamine transferase (SPINDLY family)